jgi:SAM-dependent methyltransferase
MNGVVTFGGPAFGQRIVWAMQSRFPGADDGDAEPRRRAHAVLDAESRLRKSRKIEVIVRDHVELEGARVLDVGTGSGFIASLFHDAVGPRGEVWGVDTIDQRQILEGFRFKRVMSAHLPFDDESFDVVISNHVVEHVVEREDQLLHVKEIRRVLKADGVAYVATPNRWALIEPHFQLPLLSWLPPPLRTAYLRAARRGTLYDCSPLSHSELTDLFRMAGVRFTDATVAAMRAMARVEETRPVTRWLLSAPDWLLRLGHPVVPTMVFLLRKG